MPFLNRIGSGATSKFGFRMGFAPGAPTSVTASLPSTYGNTTASVSWTAPVMVGSPALNDYIIQYSSNSGSSWTTFTDTVSTATSVTVTGLTNGTAYIFRVAGRNNIGTGTYSAASNSVTPLFGKIPTPVIGDITETTSSIPWCFTNYNDYIPVQDGGTYNYVYYDFNVNAPNDQSGICHGWTGLGENVYRETYLKLTKTGWADSDAIFIAETTNTTPAPVTPPVAPVVPPVAPVVPIPGCSCCVGTSVSEARCIYPPSGPTYQIRTGTSYDGSCGSSPTSGTSCSGACTGCSCPAFTDWGPWVTQGGANPC